MLSTTTNTFCLEARDRALRIQRPHRQPAPAEHHRIRLGMEALMANSEASHTGSRSVRWSANAWPANLFTVDPNAFNHR